MVINVSITIRKMQRFDTLILVIMFMSWLSSLAHTRLLSEFLLRFVITGNFSKVRGTNMAAMRPFLAT